jgi:hypothetical protein
MVALRRWPGFAKGSVNGHKPPLAEEAAAGEFAKGSPRLDRETTRYLAAATHLDIQYAEFVVDNVVKERFRALAPAYGVDVAVVARWAIKALRTRALSDYALSGILFLLLLVPPLAFLWLPMLIFLPLSAVAAWLVVSWEYWERIHNVINRQMLRDRFDPDKAPDPPREDDRKRLNELDELAKRRDGNLVVFSGHSTFIGSGRRLQRDHVLLDVSRGIAAENGGPQKSKFFTCHELHRALVEAFGDEHGLGTRLDNVRAHERLFVNGLHVQNDDHLRPGPGESPKAKVHASLLEEAASSPTPEARTYVCIEMGGWQGQLVVTLFVRAVRVGDSLYLEWEFRVLPPLRKDFLRIDKRFKMPWIYQARESLRAGLKEMVAEFLAAPFRTLKAWRRSYIENRYVRGQSYAIENGYVFDFGARASIREKASGPQRHHHFLARDEIMYVLLAQQTLGWAVGSFLGEHGVDQGDFNDQVKVIINRNLNYFSTGDIKDNKGPVVIGNNSKASASDPSKGEK